MDIKTSYHFGILGLIIEEEQYANTTFCTYQLVLQFQSAGTAVSAMLNRSVS